MSETNGEGVQVLHAADVVVCKTMRAQLYNERADVLLYQDWVKGPQQYPILIIAGGSYVGSAMTVEQGQSFFTERAERTTKSAAAVERRDKKRSAP